MGSCLGKRDAFGAKTTKTNSCPSGNGQKSLLPFPKNLSEYHKICLSVQCRHHCEFQTRLNCHLLRAVTKGGRGQAARGAEVEGTLKSVLGRVGKNKKQPKGQSCLLNYTIRRVGQFYKQYDDLFWFIKIFWKLRAESVSFGPGRRKPQALATAVHLLYCIFNLPLNTKSEKVDSSIFLSQHIHVRDTEIWSFQATTLVHHTHFWNK